MKILIADKLSDKAVAELQKLGGQVTFNPDLTADNLPDAIDDHEILIVRSTKVTAQTIDAAPSLSLIIRAGAGVDTINLEKASSKGIHVANCPAKNTDAVAELAIGLLIAADRRIVDASADLRAGAWKKKEYSKACGLKGRTLGVVGLGSIGKAVVKIARGLEMEVIAWSKSLTVETAEKLAIGYCSTLEELAEKSDAVTVHLAANKETHHIINDKFFGKMKKGAIFINTSRGDVVDTAALKKAISAKQLAVGLDVFEDEPNSVMGDFGDQELAQKITCTPHIGASTDQASEAIAQSVVDIVKSYKDSGKPLNVVNIREKTVAKITLVVRHYNRVGVLAGVLDELRNADINIEEMENRIFAGGQSASCSLLLDDVPSSEVLEKIKENENIIQVMLK